jgi:sigma-B regulation protein RsbU (phosphoserine phosphatase)
VSSGNLDHETVPVSKDEIGQLAQTFNKMTSALKTAREQELEQKKMEHQLSIAREIQENLMPKKVLKIPGYDVGAFYRPSQEVGGDYYDFIEIDEDHAGIIVADVSGKGVPGAIVMAMALAFIREEVDRTRNTSPMSTLVRANRMLAANIKKGMFVTAMYAILDKKNHTLKVASAGHNPMVWWRAGKAEIQLVNPKGIALGFDKGPVFERTVEEGTVVLEHGDRVVSYTDGTVESMNAANEEFGDEKFQAMIKQLATRDSNQMLNLMVKALDEHKGEGPQHDDITMVTLRYL